MRLGEAGTVAPVEAAAEFSTAEVLGIPYFCGRATEAADAIVQRARVRAGGYACFANVHVATTARHDDALRASLSSAWAVFPDGAPIAWLQRAAGRDRAERVPGPDVLPLVVGKGVQYRLRHFLLGSTDGVLERLRRRLVHRYPGAVVAGTLAPHVAPDRLADPEVAHAVRTAAPDVVWCALGAPKQELWMRANAQALAPALLLGVGAAFDFVAGTKPRAPGVVQSAGLEWLYRLLCEPRRLAGRYARTNSEFALLALRQLAGRP